MLKRYAYRAYPTAGQRENLARLFGCVRVVYNDYLAVRRGEWEANRELPKDQRRYTPDGDVAKAVTTLAKRTPERVWLSEVSAVPLQQAVRDAQAAYRAFFRSKAGQRRGRRVGAPRFKSKRSRSAARFTKTGFRLRQTCHGVGKVFLTKIGWVRFTLSRPLPSEPTSVTIVHNPDNTFEVSFVVEVEPAAAEPVHQGQGRGC